MGVLSIRLKSSFLGLLQFINNFNWFIIIFSLVNLSVCIYEDQIGKFDWHQTYVGRLKFSQFDTVSTAKKIIVATEENVLAALNLKTGQVVWRHVLESASAGNFQFLHVSEKVVTVSGSNPYLVRSWDPTTGVLLWEWSLNLQSDNAEQSEWWVQQSMLVHMLPVFGSHIEVSLYNLLTGQNKGTTSKLPATWTNDGCVLSPPYYTCVSGKIGNQLLISLDVTSNAVQIISKPLYNFVENGGNLSPINVNSIVPGFVIDNKKIVLIKNNNYEELNVAVADQLASVAVVDGTSGPILLQSWSDEAKVFSLIAHNVATSQSVSDIGCIDCKLHIPEPELLAVMCTKSAKEQNVCRMLVTGLDDSLHLIQQEGRELWSREEALSNIVAAEFIDLPVSDLDAAIESEFDHKEGSIWLSFCRRLHTQYQQLMALVHSVKTGEADGGNNALLLHRDYFNLHKIIVLVTRVGKIFGIDNLSGAILWQLYEPTLDTNGARVFTRRTARHPPLDALVSVVGKHAETGNGLIISVNPISGALVGERTLHLDGQLLQCAMLHQEDEERLHALLLLDIEETVQVLPISAAPLVENMFMYVAEKDTARVQGYALRYDGKVVAAQKTWSINLGGDARSGHKIVAVAPKIPTERVHSAGRVLGDRSVLYKYINPNLVLFVTEGPDPLHKDVVAAWCVDAVSGAVITSQVHRRAHATPLAVHSENFLAYLYYNDKQRRTEIATMELYEGKQRWIPAGGAFSSLQSAQVPLVERQGYILPGAATAAAATYTERSITDKHVMLALTTGAIVELPWAFLEPRRPITPTMEHREEGLVPYVPELPLQADAVVNYNTTLHRIASIYTAPSGLESTTLVLATGLDVFYTRVAPSKTFDLLKDDFDHSLIAIVLVALLVATYSTKYFASRKLLRMAWK